MANIDSTYVITSDTDENLLGGLVLWSASGGKIGDIQDAFRAEGLDAPDPVEGAELVVRALKQVCKAHSSPRRDDRVGVTWLVVSLRKRGAYALVVQRTDAKIANHEQVAFVEADGAGMLRVSIDASSVFVDSAALHEEISNAIELERSCYDGADVGALLIEQVKAFHGVAVRERGGVYFVPRAGMPLVRKLQKALRVSTGTVVHNVPTLRTADMAQLVIDSLATHVQALCDKTTEELPKLGDKARAARQGTLSELLAQVERYETLLGSSLDVVRTQINMVETSLLQTVCAGMGVAPSEAEVEAAE